jgi:hypothetical protein
MQCVTGRGTRTPERLKSDYNMSKEGDISVQEEDKRGEGQTVAPVALKLIRECEKIVIVKDRERGHSKILVNESSGNVLKPREAVKKVRSPIWFGRKT